MSQRESAPHSPREDAESFMKAHVRYHIDECAVISYDTLNAMATRFFELLSAESEIRPTADHVEDCSHTTEQLDNLEASLNLAITSASTKGYDFHGLPIIALRDAFKALRLAIRALKNAAPTGDKVSVVAPGSTPGLSGGESASVPCVELAQRLRDSMDGWAEEYPALRVSDLRDFVRQAADALASTPKGTNK